jgi:hypothetical protein
MGRRYLNEESFRQARDLMQHPLFPSLIRETVERVQALQLQPPASIPTKRKAPWTRSDDQVVKRRMQNNLENIFDRRETEKSNVESLRGAPMKFQHWLTKTIMLHDIYLLHFRLKDFDHDFESLLEAEEDFSPVLPDVKSL